MSKLVPAIGGEGEEFLSAQLAAERLELSVRRLRELAQEKRIQGYRRLDPVTQREATFFKSADVDRLRAELRPVATRAQLALAAAAAPSPPRSAMVPWLTLDEAEECTGLPASVLRELVVTGELPARDVGVREGGRYRVCRADLDALRGIDLG